MAFRGRLRDVRRLKEPSEVRLGWCVYLVEQDSGADERDAEDRPRSKVDVDKGHGLSRAERPRHCTPCSHAAQC